VPHARQHRQLLRVADSDRRLRHLRLGRILQRIPRVASVGSGKHKVRDHWPRVTILHEQPGHLHPRASSQNLARYPLGQPLPIQLLLKLDEELADQAGKFTFLEQLDRCRHRVLHHRGPLHSDNAEVQH